MSTIYKAFNVNFNPTSFARREVTIIVYQHILAADGESQEPIKYLSDDQVDLSPQGQIQSSGLDQVDFFIK